MLVAIVAIVCLAIVLLAIKITLGWFSPSAAQSFDRAVSFVGQASIVIIAVVIVALVGAAFLFGPT